MFPVRQLEPTVGRHQLLAHCGVPWTERMKSEVTTDWRRSRNKSFLSKAPDRRPAQRSLAPLTGREHLVQLTDAVRLQLSMSTIICGAQIIQLKGLDRQCGGLDDRHVGGGRHGWTGGEPPGCRTPTSLTGLSV